MFRPGYSDNGTERRGIFKGYNGSKDSGGTIVTVQLAGDPFAVCVYEHRIRPATAKESTQMPTATKDKPKAKDLRRQAKALGIEGWEDMSLDELIEAVEEAQEDEDEAPAKSKSKSKTSSKKPTPVDDDEDEDDDDEDDEDDEDDDEDDDSDDDDLDDEDTDEDDDDEEDDVPVAKKASAKKASAKKSTSKPAAKKAASKAPANKAKSKPAAKKAAAPREREVAENGNPYPEGSNLHYITELLIKGGKLGAIVKKVNARLTINERSVSRDEDETFKEWHRRVVIVSQRLRNDHGFTEEKDGRGLEATIKLLPPA